VETKLDVASFRQAELALGLLFGREPQGELGTGIDPDKRNQ
jgi:hypothetical protein